MALEQIPVVGENEERKDKKDLSQKEKVVDSAEHSSEENVAELDHQLAKKEADKIVEGLPDTLDQLSPEQQKQFVGLVQPKISGILDRSLENREYVYPYMMEDVARYKKMREPEKFSKLPVDEQEAFKKAEKEAISKMTEDSRGALESGGVTMPGESEPDSAPNTEPDSTIPNQGEEGNSGSEGGGLEF